MNGGSHDELGSIKLHHGQEAAGRTSMLVHEPSLDGIRDLVEPDAEVQEEEGVCGAFKLPNRRHVNA
jgi:hypothetical protein